MIGHGLEQHAPGQVGGLAPKLLVDEVPDATEQQPGGNQRRHEVGDPEQGTGGPASIQPHGHDDAEQTPVERHSAVPDCQYSRRIREIMGQVVEQHVPQPAAEDDTESDVDHKIGDLFGLPSGARPAGPQPSEHDARDESGQIHESVPVYRQRPDGDGNGVEARMGDQEFVSVGGCLNRRQGGAPIIGVPPVSPNTLLHIPLPWSRSGPTTTLSPPTEPARLQVLRIRISRTLCPRRRPRRSNRVSGRQSGCSAYPPDGWTFLSAAQSSRIARACTA